MLWNIAIFEQLGNIMSVSRLLATLTRFLSLTKRSLSASMKKTKQAIHDAMTFLRKHKHYLPSDLLVVFILPPAPPAENSFASLERGSGTKKCSLARDSRKTEARQSEEGTDEPIDQPIRIANPTSKQSARPTKKRTLPKDENASGTGVVEKRAKTEITHVKMVGGHWR